MPNGSSGGGASVAALTSLIVVRYSEADPCMLWQPENWTGRDAGC